MKQFKHAAVALAMVGMLSAQANASEAQVQNLQAAQPIAAFSQTDIDAMFEQAGQPMQLAALSQQEMRETEGVVWWMPILGGIGGGATYWYNNPSRNFSGLAVAVGSGALGGALGRISGWGVGVGGSMYSTHVQRWR